MFILNTMDATDLADLIGELDRKAKTAAKALEDAKTELKGRGLPTITGNDWAVTVSTETITALDQELVKKLLGKDLPRFQKTSVRTVVRIKAALVKEEAA